MRLAVYTDYAYTQRGDAVYAERAFALFLARLADGIERTTIIGRLRPTDERARYRLPDAVSFVPLPYYESLAQPFTVATVLARSMARYWRALDSVDAVWLLGPHPLALGFAALAFLRRRRVLLGVRQDLPEYVRTRHPGIRSLALAAVVLDRAYRLLARACPTIVVGPALAQRYHGSRRLLEIAVSLVPADEVATMEEAQRRDYGGPLTILSVGRIDEEKNPLMLAEVLARLRSGHGDWRLVVCGEGPLLADLRERVAELDLAEYVSLPGYVLQSDLRAAYRTSHFLLHASWTEGLPQVIVEALAAGLPVVATDVGGIRAAVGDAATFVPAGDADAAAQQLAGLRDDPDRRWQQVAKGLVYARDHTLDAEVERVAAFVAGDQG